ncbi:MULTISPECIES: right-handed parallel beta-helix repeat-containing protein [Flavobacterium]|uniref:Right-handed parallel beta-helix repeat-containing protein n=1 Tax=Flavobacterium jumunjinense TaxID=998845 RepID=A0ABV5GJI9_9FLAO|nr:MULTISPECIES: right-handed parallel beta-helix repeat-containing protein [Flavobacterium]
MKNKKRFFKNVFLTFLMTVGTFSITQAQRNFYVSSTGNDANNGTSTSSAWKTLNKVNSASLTAGDVVSFNKGDVFYGTLNARGKSGTAAKSITYKSYGSGNQAVIRAARSVTNWTRHNGNVWKASLGKIKNTRTPSLFLNNQLQQIGREPNENSANGGYRVINAHNANNTSISEALNLPYGANRFQGGEITIRTTDDNVKVETITSHSGNTVNFSLSQPGTSFENDIENNFGYFFQNHVNTLDRNGEWAHDTNAGVLYLYSTTNPNNLSIEIPSEETTIDLSNTKYIQVQDLRFEGALSQTLSMSGAQNVTINGCYFYNGNDYLLLGFGLKNVVFTNNVLNESNNLGSRLESIDGLTFSNNRITNIGMRSGMGARSFIGYTGIRFYGKSGSAPILIENNVLDGIGYHGLQFGGSNFTIRQNDIKNFCYTKDDGGGIYSVGNRETNNSVYKNFVHDSQGAIRGIPQNRGVKTAGIYFDNDSQNQLVYDNTVYNINGWGLMANLTSKSTYRDNTVYNCDYGIVLSTYNNSFGVGGSVAQSTNNTIVRNILFAKESSQFCARYTNQITANGFNTFLGNVNANYYCQPFTGGKEISVRAGNQTSEYLVSQFKATYPNYESNGKSAPVKFSSGTNPNSVLRFEVNNTGTSKVINLGSTSYVDAKNAAYSGSVTLAPYTSLALLKGGSSTPPPPSQLIANGSYTIESITSNQRLLSRALENHQTKMVNPGNYSDQEWVFNHLGNNIYTIKNRGTNRYLEVPFAKCENATQVATYTDALGDHQKWEVVANGVGIYGLKPAHCLTQGLDRNNGTLNTNVHTYFYGENNGNQKWKIIPVVVAKMTITDLTNSSEIKMYPNPAKDFFVLEGVSVGDIITISDVQGKQIMNITADQANQTIIVSSIKSGMYFVTVSGKIQKKLIIE